MKLTPEERDQMLKAAKPLIKWLNDNGHPDMTAIVDYVSVELVEGVAYVYTGKFLKD